jgi:DNA-binding MarR family transcriptional regulator
LKPKAPPINYGLEVHSTARSYTRVLGYLASEHDISAAEFRLLRVLSEKEQITQIQLANIAVMDRPYVASLVKRMTAKGLLKAQSSKTDRRRLDLTLTPKARRLGAILFQTVDKVNARAVVGVSTSDLAAALRVLELMRKNLENEIPVRDGATA